MLAVCMRAAAVTSALKATGEAEQEGAECAVMCRQKQGWTGVGFTCGVLSAHVRRSRLATERSVPTCCHRCFSNVDLAAASEVDQAALEGATPALSDSQFAERQAALRAALAHVKHSELVL